MTEVERLEKVLLRDYGIANYDDLVKAIKDSDGIDIGLFTKPAERKTEQEEVA